MHTPLRSCTPSADTPISRSSVSDPLPRDREQLHIGDKFGRKPAKYRSRLGSDPYTRRSPGKSACNRAAHMHGRFGLLPSLPPASRAASRRDANRITERIVVWTSWARLLFVTDQLLQRIAISDRLGSGCSLGSLNHGKVLSCAIMLQIHAAEKSREIFVLVFNTRCYEFQSYLLKGSPLRPQSFYAS